MDYIEKSKKEMKQSYEKLSKEIRYYEYEIKELESKREELKNEKNNIERHKKELYNRYFQMYRGSEFILLDDIPSFELIKGNKSIISDYSNIDLLDLCKTLERIYKRYNINFKYDVIDKSISYKESDRYDEWIEYNKHPCMNITINDNYNFYLPYESIKNDHTSKVKLIQSQIEEDYYIKYKDNNYLELPFEYKRYLSIRDLIYSIAYFKYQNKIKNLTHEEYDNLIYKQVLKKF